MTRYLAIFVLLSAATCASPAYAAEPDERAAQLQLDLVQNRPTVLTATGAELELMRIADPVLDAGTTDAAVIAGVEVPSTGEIAERAIDAGLADDLVAMIAGFVLLVAAGVRALFPVLRSGRVVGWLVNAVLTGGAVVFVYLAEDLKLDASALIDIGKGVLLASGAWQLAKPIAPAGTKTAAG